MTNANKDALNTTSIIYSVSNNEDSISDKASEGNI